MKHPRKQAAPNFQAGTPEDPRRSKKIGPRQDFWSEAVDPTTGTRTHSDAEESRSDFDVLATRQSAIERVHSNLAKNAIV
jgi:hypothetical protein